MNTIVYNIKLPDGVVKEYATNVIAGNIHAQVDLDVHSPATLEDIIDVKKDYKAISRNNLYVTTKSGCRRITETISG